MNITSAIFYPEIKIVKLIMINETLEDANEMIELHRIQITIEAKYK